MIKKTVCLAFILIGSFSTKAQQLERVLDSLTKAVDFNGVVLIDRQGKPLLQKSYGMADLSFSIPTSVDTRYKIASITKAFTAVLTLRLAEQGLIGLDKPIAAYLPNYKGHGEKITPRHLLTMTSGLPNMDNNASSLDSVLKKGVPQYQLPHSHDELVTEYASGPLVREPGSEFDYNNADYILLGKVIESVTGKGFELVLHEHIIGPLAMHNSGMLSQTKIVARLANTYFFRDDIVKLVNDLPVFMENWYAGGAMYSTAGDLLKFTKALFGGRLLGQASLNEMLTPGHGEYGFGVWVYRDYVIGHKKYTVVKRPGRILGAQTVLFHVLETGDTIIALSNTANMNMDDFTAKLAGALNQ